jgi:hypothetical protein
MNKVSDNEKTVHSAQADIGPRPRSCGPGSMAPGGPEAARCPSRMSAPHPRGGATVIGGPTDEARRGSRDEHQRTSASSRGKAWEMEAHHSDAATIRWRVAPDSMTSRGGDGLRWMVATPSRAYGSWGRRIA